MFTQLNGYSLHIAGINEGLNRNIYKWYKEDGAFYKPLLKEVSFIGKKKKNDISIDNKNIAFIGVINGMSEGKLREFTTLLGVNGFESIDENTNYLLIGKEPNKEMVVKALKDGIAIITESEFIDLLGS